MTDASQNVPATGVPAADTTPAGVPYVPTAELLVQWAPPPEAIAETRPRAIGPWALALAVVGVIVSLFVGWGFPLGLAGFVAGIIAVRRPTEGSALGVWAIVLSLVSIVYSAGWILWAVSRGPLF